MTDVKQILNQLSHSKFRSQFHLRENDIAYIQEKGLDNIQRHAEEFITKRLAPAVISNDGKQTPYHGHPVFIAEHATATCCRNCLYKWHHIAPNRELTKEEINYIVTIIMTWIQNQM